MVARDRHAELLQAIALASAGLELLATEIRHLVRTEVSEAREPFANGRKGSSPMPHKRNPVKSEQISGLARVLRGNTSATVENVALWHERDISHSSVERIILPDSTALIDHRQRRMLASGRGQSMLGDALASGSGPFPRLLRAEGGASAHACDRGDALAPSPTGGTTACSRQRSRGPRPCSERSSRLRATGSAGSCCPVGVALVAGIGAYTVACPHGGVTRPASTASA